MPELARITQGHRDELTALGAASRWVRNGSIDLHVLDYGGAKPPLLVLPGITSTAISWDFVVAPLRDVVRPLVVDLRGRGLSDAGDGYRAGDFAGDAVEIVRQLELERPVVLGHSLGARIGASLAASGAVELRGTILIDPPLSGPDRGPYPTSREAFRQQLREGYAGTTGDAVGAYYPLWSRSELLLRARWVGTCDEDAVLATYDEFTREDFFDWWPAVPEPADLIRGGDSPVVTEADGEEAAAAHPAAGRHAIPGAGHMVPWDAYDPFMRVLRSILKRYLATVPD